MIRKISILLWCLLIQTSSFVLPVYAALELPDPGEYDTLIKDNKLEAVVGTTPTSAQDIIDSLFDATSNINLEVMYGVIAGVAFIYLVVLGMKMLFSQGDSETMSSQRTQLIYIIVGLIVISASYFMGFEILNPVNPGVDFTRGDTSFLAFEVLGNSFVSYLRMIVVSITLGVVLYTGYQMIASPDEEAVSSFKNFIRAFFFGIVLILLSEIAVRVMSGDNFKNGNKTTVGAAIAEIGIKEIIGLVNYMLTFIGVIAFFMLVLAAFYYVISFGDDDRTDRAKKIIIANLIAGIIAFSALVIIRIFING